MTENYGRARTILEGKKTELLQIAEELLTREVLSGDQVKQIVSGQPLEALPVAPEPLDPPTIPETERQTVVSPLTKPLSQE